MKREKGITLIALIITIIVLLILASISIATLTGENGVLTKAQKAKQDADIAQTKEQIKLELMENFNEEKTTYTNEDVIIAVEKITQEQVKENDKTVKSKNGNNVDISDLWVKPEMINFTLDGVEYSCKKGMTWNDFIKDLPNGYGACCNHNKLCLVYMDEDEPYEGSGQPGWVHNVRLEEKLVSVEDPIQDKGNYQKEGAKADMANFYHINGRI